MNTSLCLLVFLGDPHRFVVIFLEFAEFLAALAVVAGAYIVDDLLSRQEHSVQPDVSGKTVEELIAAAADDKLVKFTGTGDLKAASGVKLAGGTNVTSANGDVTAFVDKMEGIKFNTLCFPVTDDTLQTAVRTKIKYMRESMGKGVNAVMPDAKSPNHEGIINVTNSVVVDGVELTHAEACAFVAGITASASCIKSNTYEVYNGATGIVDPKDNEAVNALLPEIELYFAFIDGEQHVYLKEEDVSTAIRTEEVGMAASAVGANPAVRAFLLGMQRDMAKKQDVLMDGRDIGTVVLPDATVKIFLTATPEARATRRWKEYQAKGIDTPYEEVLADVKQRDYQDTHRAAAPLKQAEDAVLLDTSELDFEQSLAAMKKIIAEKAG